MRAKIEKPENVPVRRSFSEGGSSDPIGYRNWKRRLRNLACLAIGFGTVIFWVTQPLLSRPITLRSPPVDVDPARLEAHVRTLVEQMTPRDYNYPENMERAADYIKGQLKSYGARVAELSYEINGRTFRIISGLFGPEAKERIVVGAHYDAVPVSPGADDNASGVAGLLELAAAFGEKAPQMLVELAAYPNEEPPFFKSKLMGSYVHARNLKEKKVPVRFMIALERPYTQIYPNPFFRLLYPSRGNFIAVVSRLRDGPAVRRVKRAMRTVPGLPVHSFNGPFIIAGVDYSDHWAFWKNGYSAMMVTDTAFYRNDGYHNEKDTPETLDYKRMAKVVKGIYAVVMEEGNR
jgi:hypothetical protein